MNGPTDIALTFTDYLSIENRRARRFEQLTEDTIHFIEEVERVAAAPVTLCQSLQDRGQVFRVPVMMITGGKLGGVRDLSVATFQVTDPGSPASPKT